MRVMNHNWSATKQHLHPQSVAEISRHSVLSGDSIRQCGKSSGSRHKDIAHRHGVHAHSYADDTQLYVHCNAADCVTEAERLTACIEELDNWTTSNRLKLNADKTQIIWIGTRQQLKKVVDADIVLNGHRNRSVANCHVSWGQH